MAQRWPDVADRLAPHGFDFIKEDQTVTSAIPDNLPKLFKTFDGTYYSNLFFGKTFASSRQVLISTDGSLGLHDRIGHVGPWLLWQQSSVFMDALHAKFNHLETLDNELPGLQQIVQGQASAAEARQRLALREARRVLMQVVDLQIEACAQFSTTNKIGAKALNYAAVQAILQQPLDTYRPEVYQILNATISEEMVASAQESVHRALISS